MKFEINHTNINVFEINRSLEFYKTNLNLTEIRRKESEKYIIVFLKDENNTNHSLELTYLKDRKEPYNLGDNESHIGFKVDDFEAAKKLHSENKIICFENIQMGIYFIEDPDGYWLEILPMIR